MLRQVRKVRIPPPLRRDAAIARLRRIFDCEVLVRGHVREHGVPDVLVEDLVAAEGRVQPAQAGIVLDGEVVQVQLVQVEVGAERVLVRVGEEACAADGCCEACGLLGAGLEGTMGCFLGWQDHHRL